jgi:hypothetical protein
MQKLNEQFLFFCAPAAETHAMGMNELAQLLDNIFLFFLLRAGTPRHW